jgi:hypothetical protein
MPAHIALVVGLKPTQNNKTNKKPMEPFQLRRRRIA